MRSVELELKIFSITLEIYYLHQIVMWNDVKETDISFLICYLMVVNQHEAIH